MTARRMTLTSWHRGWIATGSSDCRNTVETLWRILPRYDCRTNHSPRMKRIEFETSHNPKRLRVAPKICDHPVIKPGNSIMTLSDRQKLNSKMRSLAKVSFLGVHYIVLQYILLASSGSPCKMDAGMLLTHPLQRLQCLWLPRAFFCSAGTVWYGMISANATANHSCTVLSQAQKQALNSVIMLEEVRISSHSMLQAFHWPASA